MEIILPPMPGTVTNPPAAISQEWEQHEAIALCVAIEAICPAFGCHVALTGGLLYKTGPRKDCDLLFYRIRQVAGIDIEGLWDALADIGLDVRSTGEVGWCYKCTYRGKHVDVFFPEAQGGEYNKDSGRSLNFELPDNGT